GCGMADELGRADYEWRIGQEGFLALPVAAAIAFHQAQGRSARAVASVADHDDALNIAASALSRLIDIYVVDDVARTRTPARFDLLQGKFARGATEFRRNDGSTVRSMSVKRTDLTSALSLVRRVGIPFSLALAGDEQRAPQPQDETDAPERK
ncbi:MAG TPA: hypothetical protein VFI86_04605, partial [Burkholderiales bacterium]|nr:hypothetical protein [Burkholderiales bacterium]